MPLQVSAPGATSPEKGGARRFGTACAALCTASGEHLERGLLRQDSEFTVVARSGDGEPMREGGDAVSVTARGPGPLGCRVVDQGDGTYRIIYHAKISGAYEVQIKCNTKPIAGSPFSLSVGPSPEQVMKSDGRR